MVRTFLSALVALLVLGGCSSTDAAEPPGSVPRSSAVMFMSVDESGALLIEWTGHDGQVLGNATAASINHETGELDQKVLPLSGFVTTDGDVGLEVGIGLVEVNWTGHIGGDVLDIAGPGSLGGRGQWRLVGARPGEWQAQIAAMNRTLAEQAEMMDSEQVDDPTSVPSTTRPPSTDAEERDFETAVSEVQVLIADVAVGLGDVETATAADPLYASDIDAAEMAVADMKVRLADVDGAVGRLERRYRALTAIVPAGRLRPFTDDLDGVRADAADARSLLGQATAFIEAARPRVRSDEE